MRRIDLHAYPGTAEWIDSQGPFVEALGAYWGRAWEPASEEAVVSGFEAAGVEAVLVAFDIETVVGAPPCTNDYVAEFRARHPETVIQGWAAVDPWKGSRRWPTRSTPSATSVCWASTSTPSWVASPSTTSV